MMVKSILNGPRAAFKSISSSNLTHNLFVQHPALSMSDQVQILSIVDATGTASIADIVAELPGHTDPVAAIFALVESGILKVVSNDSLCDANLIVARSAADSSSCPEQDHAPVDATPPNGDDATESDRKGGADPATASFTSNVLPLDPLITFKGTKHLRDLALAPNLKTPGVYIQFRRPNVYVGYGGLVGERAATSVPKIGGKPTLTAVITSQGRRLSAEEAKILEHMMWCRAAWDRSTKMEQSPPNGAAVTVEQYEELAIFAAQVSVLLRDLGLLFEGKPTRELNRGPRAEPGRLGKARHWDELPEGEIKEFRFGGLSAQAARQDDGRYLLLKGSQVRLETCPSATATASMLRASFVYSGVLRLSQDGFCYDLTHDVYFESATAAALFVSGSKGYGPQAWEDFEPDYDELESITL
jgi:hypothetical protein